MVIHVLDKAVAELIAAGEVVERPASISKELIENAIDAGARSITVEIEDGGIGMLRVADDGCGIERADIPRAFLRHATSKVQTADDLEAILTLGFRGEALASIAAVCRVELLTKAARDAEASFCRAEGGVVHDVEAAARPDGTTVTVRDVFYNTPARMKFLKKNSSEGSAVAQVVDKCALSHPEIAFRFIRDGKTMLATSGGGDLRAVIHTIYGKELSSHLVPVDYVYENRIGVRGFVSSPAGVRASRSWQNFFINGRFVRTRTAMAALEEAFKGKIMTGRFPACVLNIELDASTVDVNVHPAKTEVRFSQEKPVFSAVYFAVKTALGAAESTPLTAAAPPLVDAPASAASGRCPSISSEAFQVLFGGGGRGAPSAQGQFNRPVTLSSSQRARLDISVDEGKPAQKPYQALAFDKIPAQRDAKIEKELAANPPEKGTIIKEAMNQQTLERPQELRLIGELHDTYILLERKGDLLVVDKHAAHERILYERLKENIAYGNRQVLLVPVAVMLPREDHAALLENLDGVEALGFLVEDFGSSTVAVRETPLELGERDVVHIITELAGRMRSGRRDLTPTALDRLYYSIACKSALRAGDKSRVEELARIVELLQQNPQITHCPHGRPVTVELTLYEIEKLFGRQG